MDVDGLANLKLIMAYEKYLKDKKNGIRSNIETTQRGELIIDDDTQQGSPNATQPSLNPLNPQRKMIELAFMERSNGVLKFKAIYNDGTV